MILFLCAACNSTYFILKIFKHTHYILLYMCIYFWNFLILKILNFEFSKIKVSIELGLQNALLSYRALSI